MLASANAAEDIVEQWYMQPRLNLHSAQNAQNLLNNHSIEIGHALNKRINLEINLLSDKPAAHSDYQGIVLDGRYYLRQSGQFSPYIAGGISSLKNARLNTSYDEQTTNIGLGFEHTLKGNGAKILADFRYFMDDHQNAEFDQEADNDWTFSLGVSIPISMDLFK